MKKVESIESIKSKANLTVGFTLYFVESSQDSFILTNEIILPSTLLFSMVSS